MAGHQCSGGAPAQREIERTWPGSATVIACPLSVFNINRTRSKRTSLNANFQNEGLSEIVGSNPGDRARLI
jgi:hypothetical protein